MTKNTIDGLKLSNSNLPLIFITYTNNDEKGIKFASNLRQILIEFGYDVFLFEHSKKEHYGEKLWNLLANEIEKRQILIVVCTETITVSYGAEYEINQALSRRKIIIPLKKEESYQFLEEGFL